MKRVAIIPCRRTATRFGENKALSSICGKPMIQWVYERARQADFLTDVLVATDDEEIYQSVRGFAGRVEMTDPQHRSGSDRVAEAARILDLEDDDIVLNIQGDQPTVDARCLPEVVSPLMDHNELGMTTLIFKITNPDEIHDPFHVKCVFDEQQFALYFSRSPIPFGRDPSASFDVFRHHGIYAFRNHFLQHFSSLPSGTLEQIEKLEHLRAMEHGYQIKVVETLYDSIEVDRPEDIKKVEAFLKEEDPSLDCP